MSGYNEYFDKIKLNEEQHQAILDAVKKEEALLSQAAENTKQKSSETAKIRFMRRAGLIASCAALLALVIIFPLGKRQSMTPANDKIPEADTVMSSDIRSEGADASLSGEKEVRTDAALSPQENIAADPGSIPAPAEEPVASIITDAVIPNTAKSDHAFPEESDRSAAPANEPYECEFAHSIEKSGEETGEEGPVLVEASVSDGLLIFNGKSYRYLEETITDESAFDAGCLAVITVGGDALLDPALLDIRSGMFLYGKEPYDRLYIRLSEDRFLCFVPEDN